jgi:hypothetical protein
VTNFMFHLQKISQKIRVSQSAEDSNTPKLAITNSQTEGSYDTVTLTMETSDRPPDCEPPGLETKPLPTGLETKPLPTGLETKPLHQGPNPYLLSWKIEKAIAKEDILATYLNNVYLGSGAYGVADAAWVYFSKSVYELTLSEMAMIAGLPPAPSVYSPLVNPDISQERRDLVLNTMVESGFITAREAAEAKAEPLALNPSSPKRLYVEAPYFTSYIQKELPKYVSSEAIELGGLTVETTVNPKWQKVAEQIVREAVGNRWICPRV